MEGKTQLVFTYNKSSSTLERLKNTQLYRWRAKLNWLSPTTRQLQHWQGRKIKEYNKTQLQGWGAKNLISVFHSYMPPRQYVP